MTEQSPESARLLRSSLVFIAVAALAFGAMWKLRPRQVESTDLAVPTASADPPPSKAPEPAAAVPVPQPAPAAEQDGLRSDVPEDRAVDLVDNSYQRVTHGMRLEPSVAIELYNRSKREPRDGRPQLVLGIDAMNRGWYEPAVGHFVAAFEADPMQKLEPRMLESLIDVAAMGLYHDKAADAVRKVYGQEALEAVDARIERERGAGHATRGELLERLREQLARGS